MGCDRLGNCGLKGMPSFARKMPYDIDLMTDLLSERMFLMFNTVYIPAEEIRELRARILIAGELVERGTTVVIRLSRGVFSKAPNFSTSVILYKGLN
jgi:hypothetical protein